MVRSLGRVQGLLVPSLLVLLAAPLGAQAPSGARAVKLSAVITAFLVDAGTRTRGLAWTTGGELPVQWESPGPVTNPDSWSRQQGLMLARSGTFTGSIGDTVALDMTLVLSGNDTGLQRVTVHLPSMLFSRADGSGFFVTTQMVEQSLKDDGMTLQPLKCSRETEGASYGNLVDAVQAPGKTASGLWWFWQSPQQEPTLTLTLLYRRADMQQVECIG